MPSIKSPTCGLTNFATASSCKRCNDSLGQPVLEGIGIPDIKQSKWKLYTKIIGGVLLGAGLLLGLATAITRDYSYLPYGGGAFLIRAFFMVPSQTVDSTPHPGL